MSHYLHHLFVDPLGMADQFVRDLIMAVFVAAVGCAYLGLMWVSGSKGKR